MAETDGIEEAAEQLLRTATMTAAQVVEQLARGRQQRFRDDASNAQAMSQAALRLRRDRVHIDRVIARAEDAVVGEPTHARRTTDREVEDLLAVDRAAARPVSSPTPSSPAAVNVARSAQTATSQAARRATFRAELDGVLDREAVAARLLLDRSRPYPADARAQPSTTAAAGWTAAHAPAPNRAADLGR